MNSHRVDRWFTLLGHLAVVVGLVVVALELRQGSAVANGELSSQFITNWEEMDRSRQEPAFAGVYAKSIENPQALTFTELVQLDGYYWIFLDQMQLARMLVDLGLFESSYEDILRENARLILTTPFAYAWWEEHRKMVPPEAAQIISDELSKRSSDASQQIYRGLRDRLARE